MEHYYNKVQTIDEWKQTISMLNLDYPYYEVTEKVVKILTIDSFEEEKIKQAAFQLFEDKIGIYSYEDALFKTNSPIISFVGMDKSAIAFIQLSIIIKALNEGWYPNWENSSEYKYFNYFRADGGFSSYDTNCNTIHAIVPSALYLKSRELAIYVITKYLALYEDLYK